jgi:molybdopterin-guanine dinucleotide biosynthesis protein MobB
MVRPYILGIYGVSDSGKTVLVTGLVKKLCADGLKVGTLKRSRERFTFDAAGSDTDRHLRAGAVGTAFLSSYVSLFQVGRQVDEVQGIEFLSNIDTMDVVLVEGSNSPMVPKVRIGEIEKRANTVLTVDGPNVEKVYGYVQNHMNQPTASKKIRVQVNGKSIPLTEFPEDILLKTLLGMLSSLHGVETIDSFQIEYST